MTGQIADLLPHWSLSPVVEAVQAMHGVAFIVAVTVVAEVGDFHRFDNGVMQRRVDPVIIEPDAWCEWCGVPEPEERHPRRRFCSRKCKAEAWYDEKQRQPLTERRAGLKCKVCDAPLKAAKPFKAYCSRKCERIAVKARKATSRACDGCGTTIHEATRFCQACALKEAWKTRRHRAARL